MTYSQNILSNAKKDHQIILSDSLCKKLEIGMENKQKLEFIFNEFAGKFKAVGLDKNISPQKKIGLFQKLQSERDIKLKQILTESQFEILKQESKTIADSIQSRKKIKGR
jgi:hypothetical protein